MDWLYEKTPDNKARFILGRPGDRPLVCIGINPSTAEPDRLDNTLKSVERIARINRYDSWIMFNVYPQRATDPNDMHACMDPELHRQNLLHIERALAGCQPTEWSGPTVWAAWGTLIGKRDYLRQCLADIDTVVRRHADCRWVTFGRRSKDGHPHHPLYLNSKAEQEAFSMDEYLRIGGEPV